MTLDDVLAALDIQSSRDLLAPHWQESVSSMPPNGPDFLAPENIAAWCALAELPPEVEPGLQATARAVRENPAFRCLAWHLCRLLFDYTDYDGARTRQWPLLEKWLPDLPGAFHLLLALAAIPRTRRVHAARGIPPEISRALCVDYRECLNRYQWIHPGRVGIDLRVLYWYRNHTLGDLYALGRFEYMVKPFRGRLQAFRHAETGEVVALAEDGVTFDPNGYIPYAGEMKVWKSRLVVNDEGVTGFPLSPEGKAIQREVQLPRRTWRRVLAPGDPVLEIHIPGGGHMRPERCRDSMQQALDFFLRYFPEKPFVGFGCTTWFLNPELADIYRPDSNMVLFQREVYLFPIPSSGRDGLYFLFARDDVDPATGSRDTSLRRAMLDHLARGGRLRGGGMFMLKEDFPHFGTQHYRRRCPRWALGHS